MRIEDTTTTKIDHVPSFEGGVEKNAHFMGKISYKFVYQIIN